MAKNAPKPATVSDFLAIPERVRHHELILDHLVEKASPSGAHGRTQRKVSTFVDPFDRKPGGRWPGGWWVMAEVEVELGETEIYRPDLVGWRRERVPVCPKETLIRVRPDWIAEILSPSNARVDRVTKLNAYHRHAIPHYWILDPTDETLSVFRWAEPGYVLVLAAASGERVRAEPFDALELSIAEVFGSDPDD